VYFSSSMALVRGATFLVLLGFPLILILAINVPY